MSPVSPWRTFTLPAHLLWVGLFLMSLLGAGCGYEAGGQRGAVVTRSSPETALKGMLAYAEAGEWEAYVSTYYGESHKMTQPKKQTQDLAARLERVGPKLIETLRGCLGQEPKLSDDGNTATYPNAFTLYRDDGAWGFHL